MELLKQYIEAMNKIIKAGVDVRANTVHHGTSVLRSVPVINIVIDATRKDLIIVYRIRTSPYDQVGHVPASMEFSVVFNDYPNDMRNEGWKA